jgi:hypothetical protein
MAYRRAGTAKSTLLRAAYTRKHLRNKRSVVIAQKFKKMQKYEA